MAEEAADAVEPPLGTIAGGTLYRLKHPAEPSWSADKFIADINKSPLIQEVLVQGTSLRLYGYSNPGSAPPFAGFLSQYFSKFEPPTTARFAYVVIFEVRGEGAGWYAMSFGAAGRYLIKDDCFDVDAARDVVRKEPAPVNKETTARIRQVRKRRIGHNPLLTQPRAARASSLNGGVRRLLAVARPLTGISA